MGCKRQSKTARACAWIKNAHSFAACCEHTRHECAHTCWRHELAECSSRARGGYALRCYKPQRFCDRKNLIRNACPTHPPRRFPLCDCALHGRSILVCGHCVCCSVFGNCTVWPAAGQQLGWQHTPPAKNSPTTKRRRRMLRSCPARRALPPPSVDNGLSSAAPRRAATVVVAAHPNGSLIPSGTVRLRQC